MCVNELQEKNEQGLRISSEFGKAIVLNADDINAESASACKCEPGQNQHSRSMEHPAKQFFSIISMELGTRIVGSEEKANANSPIRQFVAIVNCNRKQLR
jgi:hypothetical protein